MNREKVRELRDKLNGVLQGSEWGDRTTAELEGGARFDSEAGFATFKVRFVMAREDGTTVRPEARDFERYRLRYGMEITDLGRTFTCGDKKLILIGSKPKNRKYPLIGMQADGSRFKVAVETVKRNWV